MEGDKNITIHHVWPTLIQIENHLLVACNIDPELEEDEDFRMIEGMKVLGRQYISSIRPDIAPTKNQRIAVVLNPQMKQLRKMGPEDRNNVYEIVDEYIRKSCPIERATIIQPVKTDISVDALEDFMDSDTAVESTKSNTYSNEFTTYLDDRVKKDNFNLKQWWFKNRDRYPSLFKLFLKISAIPASSAPSERTFSTSGAVITTRRSSLLPKSVENIMLVRNLYRT